jgi:uncharacterized LabA/DUF88 family protein
MSTINNFAFIDGANLHITYENLDWKIDYEKLLNCLRTRFNVTVAYYFIGNTKESEHISVNLNKYGYTIKLKTPSPYTTEEESCPYCNKVIKPKLEKNKADVDSFMTLTAISDLDIFDKAVLITSDGDFDELVNLLLRKDKLRMVFAPCKKGCSKLLRKAALGRIAFIDEYRNDFEQIKKDA